MDIIRLLGAAQGLFLAAVLASRTQNRVANRFLAAGMAAFSLDLLSAWAHSAGFIAGHPHLLGLDFLTPFLYGPVFYA